MRVSAAVVMTLLLASGAVGAQAKREEHGRSSAHKAAAVADADAAAAAAAAMQPAGRTLIALTIANPDGSETLGVKTPAGVVDVRAAAHALRMPAPLTLDFLLRAGGDSPAQADLDRLVRAAVAKKVGLVDEARVRYGRLVAAPGKIVCVGLNYRKHALEVGAEPPRLPPLFSKYNNALAPNDAVVTVPPATSKLDYETELVVVIGAPARNVSEADALKYVSGYAVGHDLSARDLQLELPGGQWMLGKTLDGFAPLGPYLVGASHVADPDALALTTTVNGRVVQSANTSDFIFNVPQIISYVSKHFTLQPGDIIFTGTPEGVIHGKPKAQQHWLQPGDEIVSSIEGLGELKFKLA